ncbi:hypothetical protein JKF63_05788 [Porcisia hertigi]|uniref:Kinesin motor domain-containing protein n=1 Tax=Porcisia hertigi TaxID=2761500 RepID=A0A836HWF5_9TRYP|nr:hypothetical protein JKF63_05788 [Porcisia hertigi]
MATVQDHTDGERPSPVKTTTTTTWAPQSSSRLPLGKESSALRVFVRVRPFSAAELAKGDGEPRPVVTVSDEQPSLINTLDPAKNYLPKATYVFDYCFSSASVSMVDKLQGLMSADSRDGGIVPTSSMLLEEAPTKSAMNPVFLEKLERDQAAVYSRVGRPVLFNAIAGYNCCVFAFGQTGSGKTFTMIGPPEEYGATSEGAPEQRKVLTGTSAQKFCRAATAHNGALRSTPDASANEIADSRFRSFASTTAGPPVCTPRTASRRDTISTAGDRPSSIDDSLSARSDMVLERPRRDGCHDSNTLYRSNEDRLQGIIPRLVRDLFVDLHEKRQHDSSHSFRVEVEYYEIYRDKVMDLLASGSSSVERSVREDQTLGPYVVDLVKKHVEHEGEALRFLQRGNIRRHTALTAMNDRSSRSHAIFVLNIVQMHISDEDNISRKMTSKVNLVDLAGSERTGAHSLQVEQFKEGVVINTTLTVLGRVIDALADKWSEKRNVFCPFRESPLTWLLKNSLDGNSKTTMVATVSPHASSFEEACQTLRYASRAKQIITVVAINEDPQVRLIKDLTMEVAELKAQLRAEGKAVKYDDEYVDALQERNAALEKELIETRDELERKSSQLAALKASRPPSMYTCSTLKASNAGAAGAAKELAKMKSDMRRLETENLLNMQTEQELKSTRERLETLEKKHVQVLSAMKDAQDAVKKMEKERHEKDRRINELEHQLPQRAVQMPEDSLSLENHRAESTWPDPGKTRATVPTSTTSGKALKGLTVNAKSSAKATVKSTKKSKAGTVSKASQPTPAAQTPSQQLSDSQSPMIPTQLRGRREDEKKQCALRLQERIDAFRKSQLEVEQLKSELKSEQEKVQEVDRALEDERCRVRETICEEEEKWRSGVEEEEAAARQHVKQTWETAKTMTGQLAEVVRKYTARLDELQRTAEQQHSYLAETRAAYKALEERHAESLEAQRTSETTALGLRQQLDKMRATHEEASRLRQVEATAQREEADALRKHISELKDAAMANAQLETNLRDEVASLQARLCQEQECSKAALQLQEAELVKKTCTLAAAEELVSSLKAAHAEQVERAQEAMRARKASDATDTASLRLQLQEANGTILKSEESRRAQVRRGLEQARNHEAALESLKSQLEATKQVATAAEEAYQNKRVALEQQLQHQEEVHRSQTSALEKRLAVAHTKSLDALRGSLEAEHLQRMATLREAKEAELTVLQTRLAEKQAVTEELQEDLREVRCRLQQMVETHDDVSKQMHAGIEANADLSRRLKDTETQQEASAAAAAVLETTLEQAKTLIAELRVEKAAVSTELANAFTMIEAMQARLADVESISEQRHENLEAQRATLANADATVEQLRAELSASHSRCANMEEERAALLKRHQEALVLQQVDTATELETQFRMMQHEYDTLKCTAKAKEDAQRSTIEKQEKELQQLREYLEFLVNLDMCEAEAVGGDSATNAASTLDDLTVAGSGAGGGSLISTPFTNPGSSAATAGGSGIRSILGSFFRRSNAAARVNQAAPSSSAPLGTGPSLSPQNLQLRPRLKNGSSATPLARPKAGGNELSTSSHRPSASSLPLFLGKSQAAEVLTASSSAGALSASQLPVQDAIEVPSTDRQKVAPQTALSNRAGDHRTGS